MSQNILGNVFPFKAFSYSHLIYILNWISIEVVTYKKILIIKKYMVKNVYLTIYLEKFDGLNT